MGPCQLGADKSPRRFWSQGPSFQIYLDLKTRVASRGRETSAGLSSLLRYLCGLGRGSGWRLRFALEELLGIGGYPYGDGGSCGGIQRFAKTPEQNRK